MNPQQILCEMLADEKIYTYVPSDDSSYEPNQNILHGKVVFSSYHQAKGLESKIVIVMCFDNSY